MNYAALHHGGWLEYREALPDGRLRIRLRCAREDVRRVCLLHQGIYEEERFRRVFEETPMTLAARDRLHDWFQADYLPKDPRQCYYFRIEDGENTVYLDQDGVKTEQEIALPLSLQPFPYAYVYPPRPLAPWARGGVGYQIFPDRFRRVGEAARGIQPWEGQRYDQRSFFGGNLRGIIESIPYLKQLGIELVYLTPIFLSDTAHRYNTFDYYQVDPMLGTADDLKELSQKLHAAGIRLILDGVFNHCGLRFAPFVDAKRRGQDSEYYDWFLFDEKAQNGYRSFAYARYMPKLNLENPEAQAYFLQVARYWIRQADIDGWRLDVSPEVWPDFWRQFRKAIRQEKPDAVMIAECWDESREWVSGRDMFDGTMHYVLSRAIWSFFALGQMTLDDFDAAVNHAQMIYPSYLNDAQWTFLSSHDTCRFLSRANGDGRAQRLAAFFQMTAPGVPIVYYGDELGMTGGDDPECRRPMAWEKAEGNALLNYYQKLIALRRSLPVLRTGAFRTHLCGADGLYAYLREEGKSAALCVLCTGSERGERNLPLPEAMQKAKTLHEHMQGVDIEATGGAVSLQLAPGGCWVFTAL